jgi:hypothetical protein
LTKARDFLAQLPPDFHHLPEMRKRDNAKTPARHSAADGGDPASALRLARYCADSP